MPNQRSLVQPIAFIPFPLTRLTSASACLGQAFFYDKLCHVFDDWVSNRTSTGKPHDRRHHESPTHFGFSLFTEKFHNTLAFMGRAKKWTLRLHSRFGWP